MTKTYSNKSNAIRGFRSANPDNDLSAFAAIEQMREAHGEES